MSVTDDDIMRQLMATFKLEADEHLQALNELLLRLEKAKDEGETTGLLEELFREAHSMKGAARAVDAASIESISHGIENVFAAAKKQEIRPTATLYDLLYMALDRISSALQSLADGTEEAAGDTADLLKHLEEASRGDSDAGDAQAPVIKPNVAPSQPVKVRKNGEAKPQSKSPEANQVSGVGAAEETIRVSTRKLDALMTHVEELLVSKIRTEQRLAELKEIKGFLSDWNKSWLKTRGFYDRLRRQAPPGLTEVVDFLGENQQNLKEIWHETNRLLQDFSKDTMRMTLVTEDLQEDIRKVRMVPVSSIFSGFGRLVRDLAREQGKQVELVVVGAETEMDKKLIEGIKDPLMHMLRNSVDHGIEKPDVRGNKGKPATGTIWLRAGQQGSHISIEVEDDGSGIDVDRVKETALARGLISTAELKTMTDEDARYLIFQSGFSTASAVTNVSGRGVGLDVVKKNVEQLNGLVHVSSRSEGCGSRISFSLPLTLSTSRVLLVNCSGETYAIPTSSVERIIRVDRKDVFTVGAKETIDVNGRSLSLVHLSDLLELPLKTTTGDSDMLSVIILGSVEKRIAFAVDSLEGETEIVIKSLGKMMARVRNVSGATVLGTGKIVVILNVADMVKGSRSVGRKGGKGGKQESGLAHDLVEEGKTILVVDDSITTRMLEKNILESAGYQVCLANDGIEALEALRNRRCDLVISDVEMPRLGGFELTKKLKLDSKLKELPVILVTALNSAQDRERGLDAGADAYIVKSDFDQKNLLEVVEQLI